MTLDELKEKYDLADEPALEILKIEEEIAGLALLLAPIDKAVTDTGNQFARLVEIFSRANDPTLKAQIKLQIVAEAKRRDSVIKLQQRLVEKQIILTNREAELFKNGATSGTKNSGARRTIH